MSQLLDSLLDRARRSQCAAGDCAARFVTQPPHLYFATIGRHRSFLSMKDALAYESGVRTFHARGKIGAIGTPSWYGWRDAELDSLKSLLSAVTA